MIRFEIPFNETIFKNQTDFLFEKTWKKHVRQNNKRFLWLVFCIGFGFFFVSKGYNFAGYTLVFLGIYFGIRFFEFYESYRTKKSMYSQRINEIAEIQKRHKNIEIWEFTEEYVFISYHGFEGKYDWIWFDSFEETNDNIIMYYKYNEYLQHIISKEEIGNDHYQKLIDFLDKKLEKRTT